MNLLAHRKYGRYVARHKWFVFRECLRLGVPLHQAVLHDWSKLLPSEWLPYVRKFYGGPYLPRDEGGEVPAPGTRSLEDVNRDFDRAWNRHQKRQPHHWQYHLLVRDTGEIVALPIPERFVREMVADWASAGLAITGTLDVAGWYARNRTKIVLENGTRRRVEALIDRHYRRRGS
jgi:hypothetical protein